MHAARKLATEADADLTAQLGRDLRFASLSYSNESSNARMRLLSKHLRAFRSAPTMLRERASQIASAIKWQ
jgi:hypothetical protein